MRRKSMANERINGEYFWVRFRDEWSVAQKYDEYDWAVIGYEGPMNVGDFDEVGTKAEPPDEIKRRVG
jgi:hypothetical protein